MGFLFPLALLTPELLFRFSGLTWARGHCLVLSSSRRSAFTPDGHSEGPQAGEPGFTLGTALSGLQPSALTIEGAAGRKWPWPKGVS